MLTDVSRFPVAVVLCDVLRSTNREKVQRIILATFRVSDKLKKDHYGVEAGISVLNYCSMPINERFKLHLQVVPDCFLNVITHD